jgi:hypothetical protein
MLNKMPAFFPSGIYVFPNEIPYYSQFASPELAYSYVHENFDGRQDRRWCEYGAELVDDYLFWCNRACGIACQL